MDTDQPMTPERVQRELMAYHYLGALDYVARPDPGTWAVGAAGRDVTLRGLAEAGAFLEGARAVAAWAHASISPAGTAR
jgi:hypothetical protein